MNRLQAAMALLSGLLLFGVSVFALGYLSAIAIPREYFAYFGRDRTALALFFISVGVTALPSFALSLTWCWLTVRLSRLPAIKAVILLVGGYAIGIAALHGNAIAIFASIDGPGIKVSLLSRLAQMAFPAWWAWPTALAAPTAFALAGWLAISAKPERKVAGPA
jgi:hypothetical protein